jgi:L-lysine 2,3-aminomutase
MLQNLGAKKFVEVGKKIKKGDTIMIVEGNENNESCAVNCRWCCKRNLC